MNNSILYRLDWWLILIYSLLIAFGIVNIYSATFNNTSTGIFDMSQPVEKQMFFLIVSLFSGILILAVNSKFFEQFASIAYYLSIFLLIGLFIFGKTVSGATSWYNIAGLNIQPSELAKVATALMIASLMSKVQSDLKNLNTFLKILGALFLPFVLIIFQPDPGSALVFGAFFFPLFREGLSYVYLVVCVSVMLLFFIQWCPPIE